MSSTEYSAYDGPLGWPCPFCNTTITSVVGWLSRHCGKCGSIGWIKGEGRRAIIQWTKPSGVVKVK